MRIGVCGRGEDILSLSQAISGRLPFYHPISHSTPHHPIPPPTFQSADLLFRGCVRNDIVVIMGDGKWKKPKYTKVPACTAEIRTYLRRHFLFMHLDEHLTTQVRVARCS